MLLAKQSGQVSSMLALDKHSVVACEVIMGTLQTPCEGPNWNQEPVFAPSKDPPAL